MVYKPKDDDTQASMNNVNFYEERTVKWDDSSQSVILIDQSRLPSSLELIKCSSVPELVEAIRMLKIRGAPAIGVAAAMGVALATVRSDARTKSELFEAIAEDAASLKSARPTAINLSWGVNQALQFIESEQSDITQLRAQLIDYVKHLADEDVATNKRLSDLGAKLFRTGESVLTHCN